jgi:aspartate carbamoyltransferase catalytic subunit
VARSDIDALVPLGATITLSGPPTLVPSAWRCGMTPRGTTYEPDLDRALDGADAVIALRLQKERQHAGLLPSIREYAKTWGLSEERVARMRPEAPVLHPGPMNEGVEIAASVAHGARSLIEAQVTNGVAVRMALLYLLAAGGGIPDGDRSEQAS